jgi:hypothetical protein
MLVYDIIYALDGTKLISTSWIKSYVIPTYHAYHANTLHPTYIMLFHF